MHLYRFLIPTIAIIYSSPLLANQAYIPSQGRVSSVNLPDGSRHVLSGLNLPASGFVTINPADLNYYTADQSDQAVYRINPTNGMVTMVSGVGIGTGPNFTSHVYGIAAETNGSLVVVDGQSGLLAVVRANPTNGNRTVVSAGSNSPYPAGTGGYFQSPFGIAVENSGNFLVTDVSRNAVIRVDHLTGNRTVVSGDPFGDNVGSGPDMSAPKGITLKGDGTIYVNDSGGSPYTERVLQINPTNGTRTVVFASNSNTNTDGGTIYSIALQTNGNIYAPFEELLNYNFDCAAVWCINPVDGTATNFSSTSGGLFFHASGSGVNFYQPIGVMVDANRSVLVVSDVDLCSLLTIDAATGNRTILTNSRTGSGPDIFAAEGVAMATNGMMVVADDGDSTAYEVGFNAVENRYPQLVQVDPATGNRTVLSAGSNTGSPRGTGGNFDLPEGVAAEASGTFVVADGGSTNPKVVRVDPNTGNRTVLSSASVGAGTSFIVPYGIAVESSGSFIVTDARQPMLFRVDPTTGNRTILSSGSVGTGPAFGSLRGVALLNDGSIAVCDYGSAAVLRVDQHSGNRKIISGSSQGTGTNLVTPNGIAAESAASLLVTDISAKRLFRVDLSTGNRTIIADNATGAGPLLQSFPEFITLRVNPQVSLFSADMGGGQFQFSFVGTSGTSYTVQYSGNLTNWLTLTNLIANGQTNFVNDSTAPSNIRRFYRVVFAP